MSRRLDIGVASYGTNHQQLRRTMESIVQHSTTDWRCFVVHNPSPGDEMTREVICGMADRDRRFVPVWNQENVGYAGAVNVLLELAETEYCGYTDNDILIQTHGWDEILCAKLDIYHEIGMIFPNGGAYMIDRGGYQEVEWGVGFCFIMTRLCYSEVGGMDESIGHQHECDQAFRVRMAGYKCAAVPEVAVKHEAVSTNNPANNERIARGVRQFVDKWCRYFGGKNLNYHSPNVLRWEDWNALYMEEYWKLRLPDLNANPEVIKLDGREYDLIKVPRLHGFYVGRII